MCTAERADKHPFIGVLAIRESFADRVSQGSCFTIRRKISLAAVLSGGTAGPRRRTVAGSTARLSGSLRKPLLRRARVWPILMTGIIQDGPGSLHRRARLGQAAHSEMTWPLGSSCAVTFRWHRFEPIGWTLTGDPASEQESPLMTLQSCRDFAET